MLFDLNSLISSVPMERLIRVVSIFSLLYAYSEAVCWALRGNGKQILLRLEMWILVFTAQSKCNEKP